MNKAEGKGGPEQDFPVVAMISLYTKIKDNSG